MTVHYFNPLLECADRTVLREHQWQRFSSMARQIWPTNGFYRRKWLAGGVRRPDEIRTWADFSRLPFTTKQELVQDQEAYGPFGTNLTYPVSAYIRQHQTSGTTGKPLRWLDTPASWEWWARCWGYVYAGANVRPQDSIFIAFSFGPFVGFWSSMVGARYLGALAITAGGQDTATRLRTIQQGRPNVLVCTPSYALHMAEQARQMGISLPECGVRTTIHAGEPGANIPATRRLIQDQWGATPFDHTGGTEVGATGFGCVAETGTHLIESEFICEVINPETLEPVAEGETGELVVTNLGRLGMPLIRYRTRDLVKLTNDRCDCGRTFARMVGGIIGRSDDMITVRGINIWPSAIEGIVREFPAVAEFQIELCQERSMNELRLKVEPEPGADAQALVAELAQALRARLAIRIDVVPMPPGSLPRFSMKAKRLIRLQ